MIAVVAAGSPEVLGAVIAASRAAEPTEVWTPRAAPRWMARVPGAIGRFAVRRPPGELAAPSLLAADAALRLWAGADTGRRYQAELWLRAAIDRWAAARVRRERPSVVIAPTLAARRTFAEARSFGARCVLVFDLPLIRRLHDDLDRAAERWPARSFLRRYRAPAWAIAEQDAERVLADEIWVRGPYARASCIADGAPTPRIEIVDGLPAAPISVPARPTGRIRLAGLATARHGIDTALAVTRQLGLTLVVRVGAGSEPPNLAELPGVAVDDAPVDAIICPAICETYPAEVRVTGIPVIASPMASLDGAGPDPYDVHAFARAIEHALEQGPMFATSPCS